MSTEALAESLMSDITGVRRVIRQRLRNELDGPPVRGSQLELLLVVEGTPGIGVAAAARALHLAGNSVSSLAGQLVQAGLLHRTTDPQDRRAAHLYLTPAAEKRLTRWREARAALVASALKALPGNDRRDIERALPALRRLTEQLVEDAP